ncbi:MAG: hypothetical protein IJO43_01590 [Bacilli bacterium]|nr:hypothetical protein [Bacilli bacterium]
MVITSAVTPISYSDIEELQFTEYALLYFDDNGKLKRAIPDLSEVFMSHKESLINEVFMADRIAPFRYVNTSKTENETSPVFFISVNEYGEVIRVENHQDNITNIESFLLNYKRRESVSKLLKKMR